MSDKKITIELDLHSLTQVYRWLDHLIHSIDNVTEKQSIAIHQIINHLTAATGYKISREVTKKDE